MNQNATGSYNTASGYNAMFNATSLNHYNVAIGYNAMTGAAAYTGATYNTAIGSNSLETYYLNFLSIYYIYFPGKFDESSKVLTVIRK